MINYQVGRLTEDERRLLEVASVAGRISPPPWWQPDCRATPSRLNESLEALARKDHTLVPGGASEWPDGTVFGILRLPPYSLSERHLSAPRAGTARPSAQAPGQAAEQAYGNAPRKSHRCSRFISSRAAIFRTPCAISDKRRESSAKRLGHAEAAGYLTRGLRILDRIDAPDRFRAAHRGVATAQPGASLMWRSRWLRQ